MERWDTLQQIAGRLKSKRVTIPYLYDAPNLHQQRGFHMLLETSNIISNHQTKMILATFCPPPLNIHKTEVIGLCQDFSEEETLANFSDLAHKSHYSENYYSPARISTKKFW